MQNNHWRSVRHVHCIMYMYINYYYCTCRYIERFLVVTESEFILVEPDTNQLGCGIVKFIAFLQVNRYLMLHVNVL